MEPLPAAPPARGTSKGGSAPRATTPNGPPPSFPPRWGPRRSEPGRVPGAPQLRSGRSPSPPRPPANCPARPPRPPGPGAGWVPEGGGPALLSAAPGTYFLAGACVLRAGAGACVLLPSSRPPLQVLCRRRPLHRTSSRTRRRSVRSPLPPHHVRHSGLRHRETRSRPACVGAQRPARARWPRDQSAALRPRRDTTASLARPWLGASFQGPASVTHSQRLGTPWRAFIRGPTGLR